MAGGYPCCCDESTSESSQSPTSLSIGSTDSSATNNIFDCGRFLDNTAPEIVKVTIANLTRGTGTGGFTNSRCENYNGTYYLERHGTSSIDGCNWTVPVPDHFGIGCGENPAFLNLAVRTTNLIPGDAEFTVNFQNAARTVTFGQWKRTLNFGSEATLNTINLCAIMKNLALNENLAEMPLTCSATGSSPFGQRACTVAGSSVNITSLNCE